MLSYRHGFHAGNHADVLKHAVLAYLLAYLSRKDKPWWFVDTHAGAAQYDLQSEWARKNAEFETGIGKLWERNDLPPMLAAYVAHVRRLNPDGKLRRYPGSPQIALQCARPEDRLRLFELHSAESEVLRKNLAAAGAVVVVKAQDGFGSLASVLPPPPRRGLVLIDPAYEEKSDYARVPSVLIDALKRFATGTYLVWYPLLQRPEPAELAAALKRMAETSNLDWLDATLSVRTPASDGFGMHGSGLFILNPPWTLPEALQAALPYLERMLGQDDSAGSKLTYRIA